MSAVINQALLTMGGFIVSITALAVHRGGSGWPETLAITGSTWTSLLMSRITKSNRSIEHNGRPLR